MPSARQRSLCATESRNAASDKAPTTQSRLGVDTIVGVAENAASRTAATAAGRSTASTGRPSSACTGRWKSTAVDAVTAASSSRSRSMSTVIAVAAMASPKLVIASGPYPFDLPRPEEPRIERQLAQHVQRHAEQLAQRHHALSMAPPGKEHGEREQAEQAER